MGDPQLVSNSLAPFLSLASCTSLARPPTTRMLVLLAWLLTIPHCRGMQSR